MRTTTIGGEARRICASAKATITYERAFAGAHSLHKDVNSMLTMRTGSLTMLPMDALLRLEYVFERDATNGFFPSYDAWVDDFPAEELDQLRLQSKESWVDALLKEVVGVFFPKYATPDVGAAGA